MKKNNVSKIVLLVFFVFLSVFSEIRIKNLVYIQKDLKLIECYTQLLKLILFII